MSRKQEEYGLIAQLKAAIESQVRSGKTLYQIGKESTIGPEQLYRFMSGKRGLNLAAADKLCKALRLRLTPEPAEEAETPEPAEPPKKRRPRKGE